MSLFSAGMNYVKKNTTLPVKSTGFTLIELLVTITIIAVVSAVVIPGLRNFNRGQDLEVAKSMLYDGLRVSQSKATSSIVCPNVDPQTVSLEINWSVTLKNDRFTLGYTCIDRASNVPQTFTGGEDRIYPVATSIRMESNSCGTNANNTKVTFSSRTCPSNSSSCRTLLINCGSLENTNYTFPNGDPFTITLINDQGLRKSLNISEGGTIFENAVD